MDSWDLDKMIERETQVSIVQNLDISAFSYDRCRPILQPVHVAKHGEKVTKYVG